MRYFGASCLAIVTALTFASGPASAGPAPAGQVARVQDIDSSVRPGDDFYRYANGKWLKATALPAGASSYGPSAMLAAQNGKRVRELIEAAATAPANDKARKIGDYYAAQMDVAGIEARGLTPLAGDFAAINAIHDRTSLSAWLGANVRVDDGTNSATDGLFGIWIHQGFHNPDHYVPHVVEGGLGLGDRDAYLDASSEASARRDTYRAHIAATLKLAGLSDAEARAGHVLDLEIEIARTHPSAADAADAIKTDNTWSRADFDAKAPGMDWAAYLSAAGLSRQGEFMIWQPSAVTGAAALVAGQPVDTWKDYLVFHLIEHYSSVLPKAFGGVQDDRAPQAVAATNAALGQDVGQLYLARYFPPQDKAAAVAMLANIRTVYRAHIAKAGWMSPATRAETEAKLESLQVGLGYPETWTDYSTLSVARDDAYGNMRRAEAFTWRQAVAKLDRPVDPAEWAVLPQAVGAILNFSPNSMQFASGILQPPYFDPGGDAAANYGSAGAGLSHEVSHTFDELGKLYDAKGRLGLWWTPADLEAFHAMQAPLIAEFSAYCPEAGLCVNGDQVAGEITADLVGLQVAYDAYHLSLKGKPDAVIDGLTGDQRFFIAFSQRWRKLQTDASLRQLIMTDIHPPGEYRSDTVRNVDAWYKAFGIKPGDKLYLPPEKRVRVW